MKVFQLKVLKRIFYLMSIIVFISALITFTKNIWDQNNLYAIIVDEEVIVYSAPLNQAIEQSVFYRGNKVKIHQKLMCGLKFQLLMEEKVDSSSRC